MVSAPSYFESVMSIRSALVHEFDIIRWLLETEIVEIQIIKSSIRKDLDFVDPIMAIIKCANGAIVDVEVNANAKYGYDVRAELVCEKGTILMSPSRKNELLMIRSEIGRYIFCFIDFIFLLCKLIKKIWNPRLMQIK